MDYLNYLTCNKKQHNPDGNAINHVRVDDFINDTDWTREEVYLMALEAREIGRKQGS